MAKEDTGHLDVFCQGTTSRHHLPVVSLEAMKSLKGPAVVRHSNGAEVRHLEATDNHF